MYQKNRRACAAMLLVSVCLRLSMALGLDAKAAAWISSAAAQPDFARFLLFLETGQALPAEAGDEPPTLWVLKVEEMPPTAPEPPEEPLPEPAPPTLNPASADKITVSGGCTYSFDKEALLARPTQMDLTQEGPQILIVHTHGSEAYTPEPGWEYEPLEVSHRTLDKTRSVIAVGNALAEALEAQGISVIHDPTIQDYPSYNDSYWKTLDTIAYWMEQYPSIQMVIDVHRDAVADEQGRALALSAQSGGESLAKLMLVVGTDQGGLEHPHWQENLANALKLQSLLEGQYPGLCRNLDLRTERFNQHMAPGSLLVEVGANGNTLTQALRSAELLGDAIADLFQALEDNGGTLP